MNIPGVGGNPILGAQPLNVNALIGKIMARKAPTPKNRLLGQYGRSAIRPQANSMLHAALQAAGANFTPGGVNQGIPGIPMGGQAGLDGHPYDYGHPLTGEVDPGYVIPQQQVDPGFMLGQLQSAAHAGQGAVGHAIPQKPEQVTIQKALEQMRSHMIAARLAQLQGAIGQHRAKHLKPASFTRSMRHNLAEV